MNFYAIPLLVAGTLMFLVGLFIFWSNKKSNVNIAFVLFSTSCSVWLFGYALVYLIKNEDIAFKLVKLLYVGVLFIPSTFYHFNIAFVKIKKKKVFIILAYLVSFIFVLLLFTTPYVVSGVYKHFWGYYAKAQLVHSLYLAFLASIIARCLFLLYRGAAQKKTTEPLESIRIKYIYWAFAIGFLGGFQDFVPTYGFGYFYPTGSIFVTIAVLVIAYTIIHLHLLDINVVFTRAGIFATVYTLVLGIPFVIGGIIVKSSFAKEYTHWWLIPVFLTALLASAGPFIYMILQRKLEARLRAQEFKSHEALRRLSHNMIRFRELNVLLKLTVHYLVKVLKLRFSAMYLFDSQSGKYLLSSSWQTSEDIELPQEFEANSYLAEYLLSKKVPLVTEELALYAPMASAPNVKKFFLDLSKSKINTVIPCFLRNALMGFLILSDRRGNMPFTQDDLNLLMVLSNEAVLAIENAQFHQKEVSQLVEKSKREALADMAPGASHQFNNRLASISSSVELLLFKMEKFNIEAHQDENTKTLLRDAKAALELIDSEVYKGKEITSAILKRAKAKVEFQEFNLANLIENAYKLVMISRSRSSLDKARDIKFTVVYSGGTPNIFASEALLQDVFYNLIDNAYDAIQDRAKLVSEGEDLSYQGQIEAALNLEGNIMVIKVKDNGAGLAKENLRKLFTPYFTTKATSNKGSGLGLCVIRDFIEVHKGSVVCDSEYGKGTAFTISLPVRKEKTRGN